MGVWSLAEPVTESCSCLRGQRKTDVCEMFVAVPATLGGRKETLLALEWTGFRDAKCPSM